MQVSPGLLLLITLSLSVASGCNRPVEEPARHDETDREILVFVAASLRESMQEIATEYRRSTGVRVLLNLGGSATLARQVEATRSGDLFISADEGWMDTLERQHEIAPGTRIVLLQNSLVLVASRRSTLTAGSPCAITSAEISRVAIADPDAAPAGRYARQWMQGKECGGISLWQSLQSRIAPAPDVRAALGLVLADPAVVGIVYRTDQLAFKDVTRTLMMIDDAPLVRYSAAVLVDAPHRDDATRLLRFLQGARARSIFEQHGFITARARP